MHQTLIILTDGEMRGIYAIIGLIMSETILSLSIIIIAVNDPDFISIEIFNCHNGLKDNNGVICTRDVVKFDNLINITVDSIYHQIYTKKQIVAKSTVEIYIGLIIYIFKRK
jgi:hypothetical protein